MFKRRIFVIAAILAVVMLVGVAGCTPAELQALQGTLKNVDSISGNVTVTLKDGTTRTFNFTDVKVDTIRESLGNATLEIGDDVTVKIRKDGKVEEVDTKYAEVHGVIKSLGTDNVTITTKKQGDITLKLTAETRIRIADKDKEPYTISDLVVGQNIEAKYEVDTNVALKINVDRLEEKDEIKGLVKAVDEANKKITLTTEKQGDITVNVTSNTTIRISDDKPGVFTDIKIGQKIEVKYDVTTKNALRINVNTGRDEVEIKGTIKAIDAANKTVTITKENDGDVTVKVTDETRIRIEDDRIAAFTDLELGQKIEAKYDISTMNAVKIAIEKDGEEDD